MRSATLERASRPADRALLRNSIWNLLGDGVPLVAVVVFLPYLLRTLGTERFGLLSLILALLAYANALNLGLGKAVTQRSARAIADNTRLEVIPPTVWSATMAQLALGACGTLIMLVAAGPIVSGIGFSPGNLGEARGSLRLLGLAIPIILVTTSFRGLLEAKQRFDLVNLVIAPLGVVDFMMPVVALSLGHGIVTIVALLLASQSAALVIFATFSLRLYPELRSRPSFSGRHLRSLLAFGGWVAISDLVFPMFTYLDRFVVAVLGGVAALPAYVIPHEIVNRLWLVPASLGTAVFPAASALGATSDRTDLERLYARGMTLMLLGVPTVAGVVVLFARDVIGLWISPAFAVRAAPLLQIFAIGLVVNSLAMVGSAILQGQGFPRLRAQLHLVELPGYLLAAWILIPSLGVIGAAWAWVIRMLITAPLVTVLVKRRLGLGLRVLAVHGVHRAAAAPVLFLGLALLWARQIALPGRIVFCAIGVSAVGITWLVTLGIGDRRLPGWVSRRSLRHAPAGP